MTDRIEDIRSRPAPELARLEAELEGLRIEERASFGPELEAELRNETAGAAADPGRRTRRMAAAASVALLLAAGAAFPARAALVALIQRLVPQPLPSAPAPVAPPRSVPQGPGIIESASPRIVVEERTPAPASVRTIPPRVRDLESQRRMIRRYYPSRLQELRIGGIVNVLVWVDSIGTVGDVQVRQSSGHPEMDRAALVAASQLEFRPALREGRPVSTWVEFDLVFAPEDLAGPRLAGELGSRPNARADAPAEWTSPSAFPASTLEEASTLLGRALADEALVARLGGPDRIMLGEPPPGFDPSDWREEAAAALEAAADRGAGNPAPLLALARIAGEQGLSEHARVLLERGVEVAESGAVPVSSALRAELHYELSRAAQAAWRVRANLGRLPADALMRGSCPRAAPLAGRGLPGLDDAVPAATLIAWNYLCPAEFERILEAHFEPDATAWAEHEAMRRSLFAALAADPGHVGANVELLLDLAERGEPRQLLQRARRFAYVSGGHPYARLLSGVALERIGRSEDALSELEAGLQGLTQEEAARIRDVRPLLAPGAAELFWSLEREDREYAEERFWVPLDPLVSTAVNERFVTHLARAVYAHLRLGGGATDAGGLWVRYGKPLIVRAVGEGTELRTELWEYGQGPAFTLRRAASAAARELTPEGRAYLSDLRATRPHDSGTGGRVVDLLPADVRSLDASAGKAAIEVTTRVPDALISGGDVLVLVLVQLDRYGERVAQQRVRIPPHEDVVVRVEADEDATELAVEVFNPALARAAAARFSVP